MGLLGFGNYSKPGPGVRKDEPQKHSFFLFFELYFRKFWKLCELNMLYFICCVPFFIPFIVTATFQPGNTILNYISLIPIICVFAITAGLTYVLRNFSRQEHAFLWMDFRDTIKSNWKQSLIIGAIDLVVYFLMIFSINFYYTQFQTNNLFAVPFALCFIFIVIFTFMQYYLFVMLITFDLNIKQLLKNAFIFSFAGLGHNLIITFFCGLLVFVMYLFWPYSFVLVPFIAISTFGFIITFNVWPVIKKYMIPENTNDGDDNSENVIFEDKT